ncbi:protein phosphatase 2C domain-containing protein [Catellatospora chokoriensis]|uniref:PPM-type phosphatase domain-containing protein n=1 Tax=Catellatospora chokoriensis TaxID=310353 RepID=A0A8J3K211_9ACTN|nr:protein phosphatase 2C domain-containing protein [Catellatospora chokoriensis]GIF91501.1 hypothetical protein Cch02nite_49450 [Catellatospora chokoriensis]
MVRSVPKRDRTDAENEDRVAARDDAGRYAIADGASTSARPDVWAQLLVTAFVEQERDPFEPSTLAQLRRSWLNQVQTEDLPWYAQKKLREGAYATLAMLHVDTTTGRFRAAAVGDSCVMHIRQSHLLDAMPVERPDDFGRFPQLLGTNWDSQIPPVTATEGDYLPGDLLVLATDAIAKFLLDIVQRGHPMPDVRRMVQNEPGFADRVGALRRRGLLDNDDTTLGVVQL